MNNVIKREVIRLLCLTELSARNIATQFSLSHTTISRLKQKLISKKLLDWTKFENLTDQEITHTLTDDPKLKLSTISIDWNDVDTELRKHRHLTLSLIWHEYKLNIPELYSYSTFAKKYAAFKKKCNLVMKQTHIAGEKVFVDYSGKKLCFYDAESQKDIPVEIFVGVLGASSYSYAEASLTQNSADWINSHIRMFEFFQGVPQYIVPDNLKSAVTKASRYEPIINKAYSEFAGHYNTIILPTRAYRPKDKALVENSVKIVQRWILAKLRNHQFFSLFEINEAIRPLLIELNEKKFQKTHSSRYSQYIHLDKPVLKALPTSAFQVADWKISLAVGSNYHTAVFKHFYSIPYQLANQKVDAKITENLIEFFSNSKRVAVHQRQYIDNGFSTYKEHMPPNHRKFVDATPESLLNWSKEIGENTHCIVEGLLETKQIYLGVKACIGLKELAKEFSNHRLENACKRALLIKSPSYTNIKSILSNKLDFLEDHQQLVTHIPPTSSKNVRGAKYYSNEAQDVQGINEEEELCQ